MDDNGQLKWRIDMHVHTQKYSPCAESLDPEKLPQFMIDCGLHGLVITEHDHLWPRLDIAYLNKGYDSVRIYRGVEVSSRNGHFLVIGLESMVGIEPGIPIEKLIEMTESVGAAIIYAHPQLCYSQTQHPLEIEALPQGIHALEVASTVTTRDQTAEVEKMARFMNCAMVGGSDAHAMAQVGKTFTLFSELPPDEQALAEAIKKGRCAPMWATTQ